jgi:uncharacterized repeat protein (TIGR02543 family)
LKKFLMFLAIFFLPMIVAGQLPEEVDCSVATEWCETCGDYNGGTWTQYTMGKIVSCDGEYYKCKWVTNWNADTQYGKPGSGTNWTQYWDKVTCQYNPSAPSVISVKISPNPASVQKGGDLQFGAEVEVVNEAPKTVTWSKIGGTAATTINSSGLLSVGAGETAASIKIYATTTFTPSKADTVTVIITNGTVTSVVVSPKNAEVSPGETKQFSAAVSSPDGAPETVTWSLYYSLNPLSSINSGGLLTVNQNETYTTIRVIAKSTEDPNKADTAIVTVLQPLTYTVTFNSNGGSTVSSITNVKENEKINKPTDPNRSGYSFDGWYKEAGLTTPWNFANDKVTQNITLYAKWTEESPSVQSVSVSPKSVSVEKGAKLKFTGVVSPSNAPQTLIWTVIDGTASSISNSGELSVLIGETATSVRVIASSIEDDDKADTAVVTITNPGKRKITIATGPNGTTNPSGTNGIVEVENQGSITIYFLPANGYEVDSVLISGVLRGGHPTSYEFTNVISDRTLKVTFKPVGASPTYNVVKGRGDFGILLYNAVVSDKAEFEVLTPEQTNVSVIIYDNMGNILFAKKDRTQKNGNVNSCEITWDLTNKNGRKAASGTYIIQATAKNSSGSQIYQYFAPIGVKKYQ